LRKLVTFKQLNLLADGWPLSGPFDVIFCRNVMIYFKWPLKERALRLFDNSLAPGGFLCLGTKESLENHEISGRYEAITQRVQIYRKKYAKK